VTFVCNALGDNKITYAKNFARSGVLIFIIFVAIYVGGVSALRPVYYNFFNIILVLGKFIYK